MLSSLEGFHIAFSNRRLVRRLWTRDSCTAFYNACSTTAVWVHSFHDFLLKWMDGYYGRPLCKRAVTCAPPRSIKKNTNFCVCFKSAVLRLKLFFDRKKKDHNFTAQLSAPSGALTIFVHYFCSLSLLLSHQSPNCLLIITVEGRTKFERHSGTYMLECCRLPYH